MTDRTSILPVLAVVALAAIASAARAGLITPANAAASSEGGGALLTNVINGAGLSGNSAAATHNDVNGDMWLTIGNNGKNVVDEWVVFDLGGVYDLSQTYIWNFNQAHFVNTNGARNVRTMDVYALYGVTNWTQIGGTRTLDVADGTSTAIPAETESLSASGVQYVAFDLLTAGSGNADEWCGLSEVRFEGTLAGAPPAAQVLTLSHAGGTPLAGGGDPANVLTDPFGYDPAFPAALSPVHSHNAPGGFAHGFLSENNDADNYWYAQVTTGGPSLDGVDVWGNQAAPPAWGRHDDLVFSFYTSTNATTGLIATSDSWNGVQLNGQNTFIPTFGRFDVTELIPDPATRATIQSMRIDHSPGSTEYLELFEVRAAHVPGPPPAGTILIVR